MKHVVIISFMVLLLSGLIYFWMMASNTQVPITFSFGDIFGEVSDPDKLPGDASKPLFYLSEPQSDIVVASKQPQTWQLISGKFNKQQMTVVGVIYQQTNPGEELVIRRTDNSLSNDSLPSLWQSSNDTLDKASTVCAIASGKYDEFRWGRDICEDFFKSELPLNTASTLVDLVVDSKIKPGTEFRLSWERGWDKESNTDFRISDVRLVYYNPDGYSI